MMHARKYVEIPGVGRHELPPLMVRGASEGTPVSNVLEIAQEIVETEEMLPSTSPEEEFERRRHELAVTLADQYRALIAHWQWGDSILEWIRQCEITFESQANLRCLLHPDVWPHAGRSSFVTLLEEKDVPRHGVQLERAVGLRLTFRQPPPLECVSDQFLFYLNSPIAGTAYEHWSHMTATMPALLPPHRFYFQVLEME